MEKLMLLPVICLYIGTLHNSVLQKRFKSHKLRQFDGFVPRKRFIRHQMHLIDVFVPQKRFNRDKRHYFQEIEEMSLELHSNIKHQPSPGRAWLIIYNILIIKIKQTFSTTIRN